MQLLTTPDTPTDTTQRGRFRLASVSLRAAFDALRRQVSRWAIPLRAAARRAQSQSLVRVHRDRISVGIDVGDLGLSRLEPTDVGA